MLACPTTAAHLAYTVYGMLVVVGPARQPFVMSGLMPGLIHGDVCNEFFEERLLGEVSGHRVLGVPLHCVNPEP